ncbi:MAG: hypothetical protein RLZZ338_2805 [Cyanobacteriota bacterium]|jgi:glutathione S-transferase
MTELTLVIGNKNYSSWSLRPWLAMKQAGLDFQEIRVPLYTPTSQEELRPYSPTKKVPVLLHGNLKIWESLAICEYIAEQFAPFLWPDNPETRAIARSISAEMHAGFLTLRQKMSMDCRASCLEVQMTETLQNDIKRITTIWQECRQKFGHGGDFLFGNFTIADAMFAPVVSRFRTYQVKLDPVLQTYADAIWELPAMQEWVRAADNESEIIASSSFPIIDNS